MSSLRSSVVQHSSRSRAKPSSTARTFGLQMVVRGFKSDFNGGAELPFAVRGYAVLVPNTRGRGGYGEAFQRGMRDGPSAARLPFEDMMAGVTLLVKRGIADPSRLGVYGHSYGGYLTNYVITQTNRFRAAVDHEGVALEYFTGVLISLPGTDFELLYRDLYGFRNPFDPIERARLFAESPAFNMEKVSTPMLLLFGASAGVSSTAHLTGRVLYGALLRKKVPSDLVLYDEGHVFERPAAVAR